MRVTCGIYRKSLCLDHRYGSLGMVEQRRVVCLGGFNDPVDTHVAVEEPNVILCQ